MAALNLPVPSGSGGLPVALNHELDRELCERDLHTFIEGGWRYVEPKAFQTNWHIQAVCEHLEACMDGKITRLLMNLPPRHMKSLAANVFLPAFIWAQDPDPDLTSARRHGNTEYQGHGFAVDPGDGKDKPPRWRGPGVKFMHLAYDGRLSTRDSVKCRQLIQSPWYQDRWGARFDIRPDQNQKTRFDNLDGGYRLATSETGMITGEGGDIICLPAWEQVWTETGLVPIGNLVQNRMSDRVWSFDCKTGETTLKPIKGWHKNPGSTLVRVGLSDGSMFECTPDHKVWTSRGWVEAAMLSRDDVLPSAAIPYHRDRSFVDAKFTRQRASAHGRLADYAHIVLAQLRHWMFGPERAVGFAAAASQAAPILAASDLLDGTARHAVFARQHSGNVVTGYDVHNLLLRQDRSRPLLQNRECAVPFRVIDILRPSAVTQIIQTCIRSLAVVMAHFLVGRWWPDKSQHDDLMHEQLHRDTVASGVESRVALRRWRFDATALQHHLASFAQHRSVYAAHAPECRDQIVRKSGDRFPEFIEFAGHVDSTFCLTVADNNTFCVGGKVIISNCFDDPHNVRSADSDTVREETLRFWDEAMPTRLNDPERGVFIVIMQRVHERDLSGHILAKEMGWTHLCLPARFESKHPTPMRTKVINKATDKPWKDPRREDEPLWAGRFSKKTLDKWAKELGTHAAAGQLQQRPTARSGGVFKRHWFEVVDTMPIGASFHRVRAWDLAGTKETQTNDPDYTVGLRMCRDPATGILYIDSLVRDRWSPAEVEAAIMRIASSDGYTTKVRIPRDPGATGKFAVHTLVTKLPGFHVLIEAEETSKENRADVLSSQCEVGNVKLLRGNWNDNFIDEMCAFNKGSHDDQVDAATAAYRALVIAPNTPLTSRYGAR